MSRQTNFICTWLLVVNTDPKIFLKNCFVEKMNELGPNSIIFFSLLAPPAELAILAE